MQGCSTGHGGGERERREGRKETGEGLPRALRRSSKFSLLFIFQVPAKLGMSAEAECKGLPKEPVPRSDASLSSSLCLSLTLSYPPPPSLCSCLLCSGLSLTLLHPSVSLGFFYIYIYLFIYFLLFAHTLASSACLGVLAAILSLAPL